MNTLIIIKARARAAPIPKNNIEIINTVEGVGLDEACCIRLANWILESEKATAPWNIAIIFVDDNFIIQLNKKFLQRSKPTDVISFNLTDSPDQPEGEIYISVQSAQRNAKEYAVDLDNELYRLAAHGLYHLLDYDDATPEQRLEMTRLENKALEKNFSAL